MQQLIASLVLQGIISEEQAEYIGKRVEEIIIPNSYKQIVRTINNLLEEYNSSLEVSE